MLTPFVECLVCKISTPLFEARLVDRMNDQRACYGTEAMFFSTTDLCINSVHLPCNKNRTYIPSTSGFYGRVADEIHRWMRCVIFGYHLSH